MVVLIGLSSSTSAISVRLCLVPLLNRATSHRRKQPFSQQVCELVHQLVQSVLKWHLALIYHCRAFSGKDILPVMLSRAQRRVLGRPSTACCHWQTAPLAPSTRARQHCQSLAGATELEVSEISETSAASEILGVTPVCCTGSCRTAYGLLLRCDLGPCLQPWPRLQTSRRLGLTAELLPLWWLECGLELEICATRTACAAPARLSRDRKPPVLALPFSFGGGAGGEVLQPLRIATHLYAEGPIAPDRKHDGLVPVGAFALLLPVHVHQAPRTHAIRAAAERLQLRGAKAELGQRAGSRELPPEGLYPRDTDSRLAFGAPVRAAKAALGAPAATARPQ